MPAQRMHRKAGRSLVAAGLLTGGLAACALAMPTGAAAEDKLTIPKVMVEGGMSVLRVHAVETSIKATDAAGAAIDLDGLREPQRGDTYRITERLTQRQVYVGKTSVRCVNVKGGTVHECAVTYSFADGTVTASGPDDFAAEVATLDITGGTGSYAGARGTGQVVYSDDATDDTLRFTVDPGQVSQVPAGGAATGGRERAPSDAVLLVGLGLVVMAGGGGMLAVTRRTRRAG